MYGGVVYPRVLDALLPRWWEEAPIQRWVTRRSTMVLTETQALTVDFRTDGVGPPPYNGATAYRPDFDAWLAGKAEAAGAELVCSTTVVGLLRDGRPRRRRAHRPPRRRPHGQGRHRLRRRQLVPGQGGRPLRPCRPRRLHRRREGDAGAAEGRHRRALRRARPRGRRHRDPRRYAACPAAGSSTRTSTRCRWVSCSSCRHWPRSSAGPRRSSPGSRPIPPSLRSSRGAS